MHGCAVVEPFLFLVFVFSHSLSLLTISRLTLEEIDQVFSIPTSKFISHEMSTSVPYFFNHTLMRRNVPKPPPLIEKEEWAEMKTGVA